MRAGLGKLFAVASAILITLSVIVGGTIYITSTTASVALSEVDRLADVQIRAQRALVETLELMLSKTEAERSVAALALLETSVFLNRERAITFRPPNWFAEQLYADRATPARAEAYAVHGSRLMFLARKTREMAQATTDLDREFVASVVRAQTRSVFFADLDILISWHKDVLVTAIRLVEWVQLIAVPATALALLSIWCFLIQPMRWREVENSEKLRLREAEARQLADRATAASAAKSDFLAMISHEIRTPMNGVLGLAEVLDSSLKLPENKRTLRALRESGEIMIRLLNDILDVTRMETGKLQLEDGVFRPSDIANEINTLHRPAADERGVAFNVHVSVHAESIWRGDPHRVAQILHNLASNAIKFTEAGRVDLVISSPDDGLLIDVSDTGVGMSKAQVADMFEWFTQADSTIARRFGGTGLGMSIVKKLIDAMDGSIQIESTWGEGTRIEIHLPLVLADQQEMPAKAVGGLTELPGGLKILAADDIATNRMVVEMMLRELGVAPDIVCGGQEAIDACAAKAYDILLLDIAMPDVDGLQALREITAQAVARGRPVPPAVAVTANSMPAQMKRYLDGGFADHVSKPVDRATLAITIDRLLRIAEQSTDAA